MQIDELINEGERLQKPSLLLTDQVTSDGKIWGYWGNDEQPVEGSNQQANSPNLDRRHWISLDTSWLAQHSARLTAGILSVYQYNHPARNAPAGSVIFQPGQRFEHIPNSGLPLYGIKQPSFPPLEALCLYGGNRVQEWLQGIEASRYDYDHVSQTDLGKKYQAEWMKRSPFYMNDADIVAVMGGWHMLWPEDDFYMPGEMNLIVWTFREAEPWVEVWERLPNFRVYFRTT